MLPLLPPLAHTMGGYIVYALANYQLELVNTVCTLWNHADCLLGNSNSARDKHREGIIAYEPASHTSNIILDPL